MPAFPGDTSAGGLDPGRLGAGRPAYASDRRARCQRRAAGTAGANTEKSRRHHRQGTGRQRAGIPGRDAGTAQSGRRLREAFAKVYQDLAQRHDIPLYPFFLDGVAGDRALNAARRYSPDARKASRSSSKRITPAVVDWLEQNIVRSVLATFHHRDLSTISYREPDVGMDMPLSSLYGGGEVWGMCG